jgi:tellurite resistance protein TerC
MVEITDIIFAVDSIPAILAVTREPFLVYTANVFAILGLRSLYFALAGFLERFHYLHYGLAAILTIVGTKMLYTHFAGEKFPTEWSLGIIMGILAISVIASLLRKEKTEVGIEVEIPHVKTVTLP